MITITKLEAKTYQGKPSGFTITLSDGRTGNLQEKDSDKGLRVGDSVTVTEIPYTSKAGKVSTLYGVRIGAPPEQLPPPYVGIAPPPLQAISQQNNPPIQSAPINNIKANATIKAMEFCVNAFIADKITWDKIKDYHKEITGYLNDAIDECSTQA